MNRIYTNNIHFKLCHVILLICLILGLLISPVLSQEYTFSTLTDPLFKDIEKQYAFPDKIDREAIMLVLQNLKQNIEENGFEKVNLTFSKNKSIFFNKTNTDGNTAITITQKTSINNKKVFDKEVKYGVFLPPFPRMEKTEKGTRVVADVVVGQTTDLYKGEDWKVVLKEIDNKWTIESVEVVKVYRDKYKRGSLTFKQYRIEKPFEIKFDSFELNILEGFLYFGQVANYKDLEVVVAFEGNARAKFTPPNSRERYMLKEFTKKETYEESTDFFVIEVKPDRFSNLIMDWPIKVDFCEKSQDKIHQKYIDFKKNYNQSDEDFITSYAYFIENVNSVDVTFKSKLWGKLFYTFLEDDDTCFEEVIFGQRKHYLLTAFESWIPWNMFEKSSERVWENISDPIDRLESRLAFDRPKFERFDILNVKVRATVNENLRELNCDTRVDIKVLKGGYEQIPFTLNSALKVEHVIDNKGHSYRFRIHKGKVNVMFNYPLYENQKLSLFFRYKGKAITNYSGGFNSIVYGWLPEYGYLPNYKYDALIDVPKNNIVVSNGTLIKEIFIKQRNIFHWREEQPIFLAGFMFAEYIKKVKKLDNVSCQSEEKIFELQGYVTGKAVNLSSPLERYDGGGIFQPEINPQISMKKTMAEAAVILEFFTELFGLFPYQKLALVQLPYFAGYGQGWPSLLILNGWAFVPPAELAAYGFMDIAFASGFLAHETSHQWWGHVVPWYTYHDQWLSEAFAQISSAMYLQAKRGEKEYKYTINNWERNGKADAHKGPIWLGAERLGGSYYPLTYEKGAMIMHMLRMILPTDESGKEVYFESCLRNFAQSVRERPTEKRAATTLEFKIVCEKTIGYKNLISWFREPTLDWFFDEWIHGVGYPKYVVQHQISTQNTESKVEIKLLQVQDQDWPTFKMPLEIALLKKDGESVIHRIINEKRETDYEFELKGQVYDIRLDPHDKVMCDVEYLKK